MYKAWIRNTPTNARFDDVYTVAVYYLGKENISSAKTGSHSLQIGGPIVQQAIVAAGKGYEGLGWVTDPVSIPKYGGRAVKKVYVERLLKLIKFKEDWDRYSQKKER
jgi:hypothetical protein